jgi:GNAT superfamily N-acetyltransferase
MAIVVDRVTVNDVDELLRLYFLVYEHSYPLAIGTDRAVMTAAIKSPDCYWYVSRDEDAGRRIVGSAVFQTEPNHKIGKLEAVVVHPEYRKGGIAHAMIHRGTSELLAPKGPLRSIYTTTRTLARGPQIMVLKDGFLPLGIFPNAHKLKDYETLTLFAKYGEGVLAARQSLPPIPEKLVPLVRIVQGQTKDSLPITIAPIEKPEPIGPELEFELIAAPKYVLRRFNATFTDPYDRFFPFHTPNLLMASTQDDVEIYAYVNKADGYCTIVALNKPVYELAGRLRLLLHQLRAIGVSYIEVLIGLQHTRSLTALLDSQFLPSALYPAMLEVDGKLNDLALMTRTLEPLNFRGMQVERHFKPYVDQYVALWKAMHLETLEVFNEYR